MKTLSTVLCVVAALLLAPIVIAQEKAKSEDKNVPPVLNFTMKSLDGQDVNLSKYQGKVVLMVNTASKCGYTPQYKDLEALYEKYKDKGLVILGFPANDFGHQEPGSDSQIKEFCQANYGVTFDMFSKIVVKGSDKAPLYQYLTEEKTDPKFPGEIKWNFEKFLISRDGQIIARYRSAVKPMSDEVVKAVEAELGK
jgi:glutathione peroxidase